LFSKKGKETLERVESLGHEVALHFDIEQYAYEDMCSEMGKFAEREAQIMSILTKNPIKVVSFHRPSKESLEKDIEFPTLVNSYSARFFKDFKYISDSAMHWRENPDVVINPMLNSHLHILTHPIWYSAEIETLEYKLNRFIELGSQEKYDEMDNNFRGLEEYVDRKKFLPDE